jgi:hypothetical protein
VDPACSVVVEAEGVKANVNSLDAESLERYFALVRGPGESARLASAVMDWCDADDSARPDGAEADWYRARELPVPGNRDFEDGGELRAVRGLADDPSALRHLTTDSSRISLLHAPEAVLVTLPGFDIAVAATVVRYRHAALRVPDPVAFAYAMPERTRARLLENFVAWAPSATLDPMAWTLRIAVIDGGRRVEYEQVIRRDALGSFPTREMLR